MLHSRDDPRSDLSVHDVISTADLLVCFHLNSVTKFLAKKKNLSGKFEFSENRYGEKKYRSAFTKVINKILSRFVHFSFELFRILHRTCPEECMQ